MYVKTTRFLSWGWTLSFWFLSQSSSFLYLLFSGGNTKARGSQNTITDKWKHYPKGGLLCDTSGKYSEKSGITCSCVSVVLLCSSGGRHPMERQWCSGETFGCCRASGPQPGASPGGRVHTAGVFPKPPHGWVEVRRGLIAVFVFLFFFQMYILWVALLPHLGVRILPLASLCYAHVHYKTYNVMLIVN